MTVEAQNAHNMTPKQKEKVLDIIAGTITAIFFIAVLWAISNTFQQLFN